MPIPINAPECIDMEASQLLNELALDDSRDLKRNDDHMMDMTLDGLDISLPEKMKAARQPQKRMSKKEIANKDK